MDLLFNFPSASSHSVAWLTVVLNVFVKGTAVLTAAALLGLLLRKASASVRFLVWSLALGTLLALPILPKLLPAWQINLGSGLFAAALEQPVSADSAVISSAMAVQEPAAAQTVDGVPDTRLAPTRSSMVLEENPSFQEGVTHSSSTSFPVRRAHWRTWILMLWLAGVIVVFARLLGGFIGVWWWIRRSEPIVDDVWKTLLGELVGQMGLLVPVKLLQSGQAKMPMTWGHFRPVIVLPANTDQWSDERRRVVLIHELAHVKRCDWLVQVLAYAVYGLYWINPLVWMALRRLRIERELACDDYVLGMGVRPSDYAEHLLQIARSLQSRSFSSLAVTMVHSSQLEGRLLAILNPRLHRGALTPRTMTLSIAVFAGIALPLAAMSPTAGVKAEGEASAATPAQPVSQSGLDDIAGAALIHASGLIPVNGGLPNPLPEGHRQDLAQAEPVALARLNSSVKLYPEPRAPKKSRGSHHRRKLRNERELEVLSEALNDPDPKVRQMSIRALGKIRDESAVDLLIRALTDSSAVIRSRAARALGKIEDPRAIQALGATLNDENREVRQRAIRALGDIEDGSAVDLLIPLLRDTDREIRREAARALGEIDDPDAVEALTAFLNDQDPGMRQMVIRALGRTRSESVLEWLIPALRDADPEIRRRAAWALGQIGGARAVEALNSASNDEDARVRRAASRALLEIKRH